MKLIGIDFTSRPSRAKPITCAQASWQEGVLRIEGLQEFHDFSQLESFLSSPAPWVAGMDFPFGQSRRFISNMEWPKQWQTYVSRVRALGREGFVRLLEDYKANRPYGDKEHKRTIDQQAGAISPQKLYGVPVAKMFFEGAPRLLDSPASIIPMRRNNDPRVIVEAYPAIIARRFIGRVSYKNDAPAKQTEALRLARSDLLSGLQSVEFKQVYGFRLSLPSRLRQVCIEDATGDRLDAILCSVQAAWAWLHREHNYGVPADVDANEGWIPDPMFLAKAYR